MSDEWDYLDLDDLLEIADGVMAAPQVREMGLLASAAARPQTTVFGENAYPRFEDQAAALKHSLARNHALVDGNKRLAWAATRVFCLLNDRDLSFSADVAEALVVGAAAGGIEVTDLAHAIRNPPLRSDC